MSRSSSAAGAPTPAPLPQYSLPTVLAVWAAAALPMGLLALVEQSIAHLANAWSMRRWRGLLYRVRDVFRAAGALVGVCRWLHRVPA